MSHCTCAWALRQEQHIGSGTGNPKGRTGATRTHQEHQDRDALALDWAIGHQPLVGGQQEEHVMTLHQFRFLASDWAIGHQDSS